jgi:hypothetical protein
MLQSVLAGSPERQCPCEHYNPVDPLPPEAFVP